MKKEYFVCTYNMRTRTEINREHYYSLESAKAAYASIKKSLDFSIKNIPGGRFIDLYLVDYQTGDIIQKDRFIR